MKSGGFTHLPDFASAILILGLNPKGFRLKFQLKTLCKGKSAIDNPVVGNPRVFFVILRIAGFTFSSLPMAS
jgi:hypothetical protein